MGEDRTYWVYILTNGRDGVLYAAALEAGTAEASCG